MFDLILNIVAVTVYRCFIGKVVKCHCVVSLKLMDMEKGRKAVGGKIEIHMRIREPLVDKDVKVEKWKWLVIDVHLTSRKVSFLKLFVKIEPFTSLRTDTSNSREQTPRRSPEDVRLREVPPCKLCSYSSRRLREDQRPKSGTHSSPD